MTKDNSTAPARTRKPRKPKLPPGFPLTLRADGRFCKKVRRTLHYFGRYDPENPAASIQTALDQWLSDKDALLAGRTPRGRRTEEEAPTLRYLCDLFMKAKQAKLNTGNLSRWTFREYHNICAEILRHFGKDRLIDDIATSDFDALALDWSKRWSPVRLGSEINRARVVFNWVFKRRLIPAPIDFGEVFCRPSRKSLLLHKHERGPKMFEASELRRMIDAAMQPVKAMLLLAINGGLGNNDVGELRKKHLDLDAGYLNYPRPKTGIMRRIPLWPETLESLREWFTLRPTPANPDDADLVFITSRDRRGWTADIKARPLTNEVRKLLDRLKIGGHRNYYAIRHTFATIGGESCDQVAVNSLMGHSDGTEGETYREKLPSDARLQKVVNVVRDWLYELTPAKNDGQDAEADKRTPAKEQATSKSDRPRLRIVSADDDEQPLSA